MSNSLSSLTITETEHGKYFGENYFRPIEVRARLCDKGCYCPPRTGYGFNLVSLGDVNSYFDSTSDLVTDPIACPAGTFNDVLGLEREADCKTCPAGAYCDGTISGTDRLSMYPTGYSDTYDHGTVSPILCLPGT